MTEVAYNETTTSKTPCIKAYNTEHKYINFGLFEVETWKWTQLELRGSWCLVFPSPDRWNPTQKRIQWPIKIRHSRTSRAPHTQRTPKQTREKTPIIRNRMKLTYSTVEYVHKALLPPTKPETTHNNCEELIVTSFSSLDGSLVREP